MKLCVYQFGTDLSSKPFLTDVANVNYKYSVHHLLSTLPVGKENTSQPSKSVSSSFKWIFSEY